MKNNQRNKISVVAVWLTALLFGGLFVNAQTVSSTTQTNEARELLPAQTIEREITGAQTHRYKFDLQSGEFFQVRVEQKGVDVALKLTDDKGNILATMDSPNGKAGFETLTWVAVNSGNFVLEVTNSDTKIEKGIYIIKREYARTATGEDKQQVEIEKNFVEGFATVIKLNNEYQKADAILEENYKKPEQSRADAVSARIKFKEAISIFRSLKPKAGDENLKTKISRFGGKESQQLLISLKNITIYSSLYEALTLDRIAQTHYYLGEWNEYVEYGKLAVIASQEFLKFKDDLESNSGGKKMLLAMRSSLADDLAAIGNALYSRFGQFEESIKYSEQSAELREILYQETKDEKFRVEQGLNLMNIAFVYDNQSKYKAKAIDYYIKSLEIFRTMPRAKSKVAEILGVIGSTYASIYEYESARKYLQDSLEICRELNDKQGQVDVLNAFAVMYLSLSNEPKFKEYINQSLDILESPDYEENTKKIYSSNVNSIFATSSYYGTQEESLDNLLKRTRLQKIAFSYELLKDYEKSLEYNKQSLEVARSSKEPDAVRSGLRDVAYSFAKLQRWNEAANYYQQALKISRQTQDQEAIATDLQNLGWTLLEARKMNEALQYQNEALSVFQSVGVDENKAFLSSYSNLLNETSRSYYALGNKRLAIFYGKRAVNAMQGERQRLQNLDAVSQKGFLENKEKHYRRLADWLIADGRIAEAEQVLGMLKEEEYFDFLRRDDKVANELKAKISLTPAESEAFANYEKLADKITEIGKEFGELEAKRNALPIDKSLDAAEQARYDILKKQLSEAKLVFNVFLDELKVKFGQKDVRVAAVESDTQGILKRLKEPRTVIISTVAGEDRLSLIVTTADISRAHTVDIKAAELNRLVLEFREAVKNPNVDPRAAGRKLYDVLFPADLRKDLDNINADTIVWSLDGTLRYAPLAALWDGKQYLVERYATAVLTLASRDKIVDSQNADRTKWLALGVGVSKQATLSDADGTAREFPALSAVPEELCGVVADPKKKDFCAAQGRSAGVMKGVNLSDDEFTLPAFENYLGRTPVVHIASHFSLNAGNEADSYLLLGGKQTDERKFTVARMKNETNLTGVELLTLSACNTAMTAGEKSNGVEIEGFGALAQNKGAKSVLASLWSVADASTRDLMIEFYKQLETNPNVGKAEALRAAQLKLIGKRAPDEAAENRRSGTVDLSGKEGAPKFKRDAAAPFAHPFYWSPFILFGNWR